MKTPGASATEGNGRQAAPYLAAFTDPEAYAFEAIKLAAGATALGFGGAIGNRFNARLTRLSVDRLGIGLGRASASVTLSSGVPNAHVFMFATEAFAARRISGWTVSHRHIFHPRPGDHACAISPREPGPSAVVTVPFDLLDAYGVDVAADDDRLFLAPEGPRARLVALMNDVDRLAREEPWVVQMPAPARALQGAVLEALLACLAGSVPSRDRVAPGRHRRIVARLERALRQRPEEMLSLADLCGAVGVAQRTLNLACEAFLGQSAMRYARGRRLDHVRRCLLLSTPEATRVTDVAMRFGFWELGRFAQAYRARFGERPSETLRRAPDAGAPHSGVETVHAKSA